MNTIIKRIIGFVLALAASTAISTEPAAGGVENPVPSPGAPGVPFDIGKWLERKEPAYMVPITLSADGKWLAVTMSGLVTEGSADPSSLPAEAGIFEAASEDLAGAEVFIVERESGKVTRPFQKFAGSYGPVWSPTGAQLALAVQDSPTRLPRVATWSPGDAAPHIFSAAPSHPSIGFTAPTWTPDGGRLVFNLFNVSPAKAPRLVVQTPAGKTGEAKSFEPPASRETLAVLDLTTGVVRPFKGFGPYEYARVWGFRLSHDGKQAAFLAQAPRLQPGVEANPVRLTVVNLENGEARNIGAQQLDGWGQGLSWSPDGRHIAWHAVPGATEKLLIATVGEGAALREVELPKEMKESHMLNPEEAPTAPPLWMDDSSGFWIPGKDALLHFDAEGTRRDDLALPAGMGGTDWLENSAATFAPVRTQAVPSSGDVFLVRKREIERVNLKAASPPAIKSIRGSAGAERAFDSQTSTIFTLRRTTDRGWEVVQTDLADGKSSRLALLYAGLPKFSYGQTRTLSWKLADGKTCKGTLLLPGGWREGDKPPVVMDVYGGDKGKGNKSAEALNEESNIINPHLLGIRGYAFFKSDMPQTEAEPMASLVLSADAAAGALEVSGLVDANRIGIMGQSYGGYTALCALTGSKRFKAGIVANGIYDLPRAETDGMSSLLEGGQFLMRASLWEKTQRFIDNSPLYALDKLQTPLLVVQGGADEISKEQGKPLFNALQQLGKPAEFVVGTGMDHVPITWSIETQRELIPRLLEFLDKHLKATP